MPAQNKPTVGCVPEHFSAPLYISNINTVACPAGTGQMMRRINAHELDFCVALTEGVVYNVVSQVLDGNNPPNFKIAGSYTNSPLCWAISVSPSCPFTSIKELKGKKIGISRYGSGSHIMAIVLALQEGWLDDDPFEFIVLNDFKSLREGVTDGTIDAFFWEIITTKPWFDDQTLKMIGHVTTPWDAFLLCAHSSLASPQIIAAQKEISESVRSFSENFETEGLNYITSTREKFHYPEKSDVRKWFESVQFNTNVSSFSKQMILNTIDTLVKANLINLEKKRKFELANGDLVDHICDSSVLLHE